MEWTSFRRWLLPIGVAVAAYAAQRAFPPGASEDSPPAAPPADAASADPGARVPQVELLGGPGTRADGASEARLGDVTDPRAAEAARRRAALEQVLAGLEGAPVYVEGVDGPSSGRSPPPPPARRPARSR